MATTKVDINLISATGTASSSTFLRGDSSWTALSAAPWVIIGTATASDSASLTVTGISDTYEHYVFMGSDLHAASDSADAYIRFGDSGGIDSGASDYFYHSRSYVEGSESPISDASAAATFMCMCNNAASGAGGVDAGESMNFTIHLNHKSTATGYHHMHGNSSWINVSTLGGGSYFNGGRNGDIDMTQIQFLWQTGNIVSGRVTLWGISHA